MITTIRTVVSPSHRCVKTWLGKGRAHSASGTASEKQAERG